MKAKVCDIQPSSVNKLSEYEPVRDTCRVICRIS